MTIKTYSELRTLKSFDERLEYLTLYGSVGITTFGADRFFNQDFYNSREWRNLRHKVITRDGACDLGVPGFEIYDGIRIHHMNPVTLQAIEDGDPALLDPEFLICTSLNTHNAIHFCNRRRNRLPLERKRGDTIPWRAF